jgi:hypothetical protein
MPSEPASADREPFKKLAARIALEDTVEEHPAADPPDPDLGRNPEQDFFLRYAGG